MEDPMAVTWKTIQSYFTTMDVEHMKQVSANWPMVMDLHEEASVLYYATQIHAAVASGRMPIGEPRWTPQMVADFLAWWKSQNPAAKPIVSP
jgi:hypothetical protein